MAKKAKSKPISKRATKFHGFSKLPIELRLKIYKNCFVLDRPVEVDFGGFIEQFEASSQLLVTCKEVYNDALSVLYGNNRFIANCFSAALRFNESVGGKATSCVQHLVLHDWVELYQPLLYNFSALQPFTNLKSLCLPTEIQARAPRYPPPCPASGTTIPSKNTRLLPKTLPEIPQTILNLSQAENGLDITLAVVFEMFSLQTFPTNGHWCGRRTDRYRVIATPITRTRNCNTRASLLGTGYNLVYLNTATTEDYEENFGVKGYTDYRMRYLNRRN